MNRKLSVNQLASVFFFSFLKRMYFSSKFQTYTLLYDYILQNFVFIFEFPVYTCILPFIRKVHLYEWRVFKSLLGFCFVKKIQDCPTFLNRILHNCFTVRKIKVRVSIFYSFFIISPLPLYLYLSVSICFFSTYPNIVSCWIRTTAFSTTSQTF